MSAEAGGAVRPEGEAGGEAGQEGARPCQLHSPCRCWLCSREADESAEGLSRGVTWND